MVPSFVLVNVIQSHCRVSGGHFADCDFVLNADHDWKMPPQSIFRHKANVSICYAYVIYVQKKNNLESELRGQENGTKLWPCH